MIITLRPPSLKKKKKKSLSVNKPTIADVRNAIKKQYIRDAASSLKNTHTHIIYRREVV